MTRSGMFLRVLMLGAIGLLALLVVLDRTGAGDASGDEGAAPDDTAVYMASARSLARRVSLASQKGELERRRDELSQAWQKAAARLVSAPTRDLAEEDLQDRIARECDSLGVTLINRQPIRSPSEQGEDVHLIEIRADISVKDVDGVLALVDRLENLDDLALSVRRIEVRGPGLKQIPRRLDAQIWVQGVAYLGGGAP